MGLEIKQSKERLFRNLFSELNDHRVVEAMINVPREKFVPPELEHLAYEDSPLAIECGQTISQPYIVALMISLLDITRMDRVLDVGTGSGYQAAVLAELAREVVSVERIQLLVTNAQARLDLLAYKNITLLEAGPELGLPGEPRFNAIIVGSGAPRLPKQLVDQLEIGGRLVVPVGSREEQQLMKIVKTTHGFSVETLGRCRFVPLIGEGAWPSERCNEI